MTSAGHLYENDYNNQAKRQGYEKRGEPNIRALVLADRIQTPPKGETKNEC